MKKSLFVLGPTVVLVCGLACAASDPLGPRQPLKPMEVAISVDDIPAHGDAILGVSRMDITRGVLKALKANGVEHVYGFAIGCDDDIDVLKEWLIEGYPLGNHTYSHTDLGNVTASAYIADIEKMDLLLQSLAPVSPLIKPGRVFRYPFLQEGDTLYKRNTVRSYLSNKGYRIAEVTVDYQDWVWNAAYVRCLKQHDDKSIAWLKDHIVSEAERSLRRSNGIARVLFHRDIAQILLVHDGVFDALMLGTILKDLRSRGVILVTLDRALADPVYRVNPNRAFAIGLTFLEQIAEARNVNIDRFNDTLYPRDKLDGICKSK